MSNGKKPPSTSFFGSLIKIKPTKPGEVYGVPGQGDSLAISAVSALCLIGFWSLATWAGWIKPLFLPSPLAIFNKFIQVSTEGFADRTLLQHTWISVLRALVR